MTTEEQAALLTRFNAAAAQYAPGLYCLLQANWSHFPAAGLSQAFDCASVSVSVHQHPAKEGLNCPTVLAYVCNADTYDAAEAQLRAQLAERFGVAPDPADLLPLTETQGEGIIRLLNDPRITPAEKAQNLLRLNRLTQAGARAKAAELQGLIDTRPLPARRDRFPRANPAALHNVA